MNKPIGGSGITVLVRPAKRELLKSSLKRRSVKPASKHWQPPEGLSAENVQAVVAAAACERDRLLLTTLWATGARISEVLALRPRDVRRQGLALPNLKNPSGPVKTPIRPSVRRACRAARRWRASNPARGRRRRAGLPGELLLWAREHDLDDDEPLFFFRQRGLDGRHKAIDRVRAWQIVKSAAERAEIHVLALRASAHGQVGEPTPVHPHLFRHARMRQIVRHTKSLALEQKQAGWARLHTEYLTLSDNEAHHLMRRVPE